MVAKVGSSLACASLMPKFRAYVSKIPYGRSQPLASSIFATAKGHFTCTEIYESAKK